MFWIKAKALYQIKMTFTPFFLNLALLEPTPPPLFITNTSQEIIVVTFYAQNGFKNLYPLIQSSDTYPCASSLSFVECFYQEGDSTAPPYLFIDWDRVNIFLHSYTANR